MMPSKSRVFRSSRRWLCPTLLLLAQTAAFAEEHDATPSPEQRLAEFRNQVDSRVVLQLPHSEEVQVERVPHAEEET